ncbi:hypothetical protein BGZ98_000036 [Dissophora globulifera]|nr:hypothetical protein BGZ98_000036 [Dissophora globulifera]
MNNDDVRVYGKHLQSPSVIHQACIVDWTIHEQRQREEGELQEPVQVDLGSYLSLYRFRADEAGHESRPAGLLSLVHEQPVFGTIKDVKALRCTFESDDEDDSTMGMDIDNGCDCPRLGYLPKGASSNVLMATSDSGLLSFVTFHFHRGGTNAVKCGQFYILKEIEIAEPGFDYSQTGASIVIDPTSRIVAISALQNHIKLVLLKNTRRSHFDPVEKILKVDLKGTILGMDFLTTDSVDTAILAVLFYNKETSRYHIATFHIGLQSRATGSIPIRVGTSQLRLSSSKSVILLKALPNISCSLVCVDEEKITLITVDAPTHSGAFNAVKHTYHGSLHLLKREILGGTGTSPSAPTDEAYALISACATPPRSPYAGSDQTLYLGSDTSELYRVNIQYLTYTMQFELVSGDRPVGNVMQVLARRQFTTEPLLSDVGQSIVLNTDYLIYSNDYGDGGVLAVREEEDGIDLFAVTELENCSPVLDFCAREPSFPGRDSLYVCSGMRNEGSLQRIRAGISVESSGSSGNQFFAGATGLWSAKESDEDAFDSYLLVSFIQSTKLMRSGDEGALEDVSETSGLGLDQATVQAGRLRNHMIFQVHRSGVVAIDLTTGTRFVWNSDEGVLASACLIKDGFLALGQITSGSSRLIVLEQEQGSTAGSFKIVVSMPLRAEPTAIHCWTEDPQLAGLTIDAGESGVFCCVGTLEPAILVFYINANSIREVYKESMSQAGLESVTIPHAICLLRESRGQSKVVVGLRDGNIIAYDWTDSSSPQQQSEFGGRCLSSPRLFKLGILPVKLAFADSHSPSGVLMLSDKLWQARFDGTFEIQPVLFDNEVSQVCSFQSGDEEHSSKPGYVFIVDHHDIQLVTLEGSSKYSHQTLALGHTPRRILDITSKKLLLVASVGDGFPFAESTLQLVDPDRFSHDAGIEKQHIVAEFTLRQGEAVFALAENGPEIEEV